MQVIDFDIIVTVLIQNLIHRLRGMRSFWTW
jgi:hypothetical protein